MEFLEKVFSLAAESGLIAALFTGLLIYVLRDTAKRESKYQDMIEQLHGSLQIVREIHNDVVEIKKSIAKE